MEFVYPQFFWVMIVPFVIFAFLVTTNRDKVARVFSEQVLERLRADSETLPNSLRNLVLFTAVFLMIVALARPVIDKGEKVVPLQGITLLTALDISGSMRSKDRYPNRLEFAKVKLKQFLDALPGDQVGLMAFARNAFVLAPFTGDTATLKQIVDGVNEDYINMAATDFVSLAEEAARLLAKKKEKILVVFTDGGDPQALKGFKEALKERGITLYAVLVGTKKGAPVLDRRGRPMTKRDGTIAITQLNEALGKIARETGGDYVIAGNGREDMRRLAEEIHRKFSSEKQGAVHIHDRVELFIYPLMGAVLLLLIGLSSMPRSGQGFRRGKSRARRGS
ncbi:vWA domain-containing protein [Nitratifractor salsuginis]|uniref:von Willebrand factor type A n=1 Tax=Nitratifractor salsuginis (strain DSM 16511 / JCM 12458 / E9I37-1) TaxID=749222 RepID=E6WZG7_NITSE|nr:VWA domain-containing protein [Nitratifractor salsuginis]ADV45547.1 von Willebrand factor type A [Nitratifractor salsuginis DSM 16511]